MTRLALLLALLALPACSVLQPAADCLANPDAPREGDERVHDMSPADIPDARRLPAHLDPHEMEI